MRDSINMMIQGVLGGSYGLPMHDQFISPEIEEAKEKALKTQEQLYHNSHNYWLKKEWDTARLGSTCEPLIQEILDGIDELGLPLTIHMGKGYGYYYAALDKTEEMEGRLYKITNKELGHHLQFSIRHDEDVCEFERERHVSYGRIHGDMYWVDTERQGSYFNCKRFLKKQLAPLFLEHLGYSSIYGTAMCSAGTEIRSGAQKREDDWRWMPRYVGLDEALNPIFINGLQFFYLMLGYTNNPYEINACHEGDMDNLQAKSVNLLSKAASKRTREWLGEDAWDELTKYNEERMPEWRKITRQRESLVDKDELEKKKATVLADMIERQILYEELE